MEKEYTKICTISVIHNYNIHDMIILYSVRYIYNKYRTNVVDRLITKIGKRSINQNSLSVVKALPFWALLFSLRFFV